ncbi:uncharacterized protein BDZ99DRAFT_392862, partial [Mytilinidion resinicola]
FENAFKEEFIEGNTNVIEFDQYSGSAYWRVFEYLYTGAYSDGFTVMITLLEDPALLKDLRVYTLADMFFSEGLKKLALKRFQQEVEEHWRSDESPECIREVYSSTHERAAAVRAAVVEVAARNVQELGRKEIFQDLIRKGGDFAVDYVERLGRRSNDIWFGR